MTSIEFETQRIQELAAEYQAKGYDVVIRPAEHALPEFLRGFQPDLVALSPGDNVVVEVKNTQELRSKSLARLSEVIENHSGWRFELVVANRPSGEEIPSQGDLAVDELIRTRLLSAEELAKAGQLEAAAMLAWSAAEAVLRTWARVEGVDAERKGSSFLLKQLYSLGFLDERVYEDLVHAMEYRNAVAHGFSARVDRQHVQSLIEEVKHLHEQRAA